MFLEGAVTDVGVSVCQKEGTLHSLYIMNPNQSSYVLIAFSAVSHRKKNKVCQVDAKKGWC